VELIQNQTRPINKNAEKIQKLIDRKNQEILKHPYFHMCRSRQISKDQIVDVIKQVYCFSIFFERLLTRRIAECTTSTDVRLLQMARGHLRDELGHVQLFADCLRENGVSRAELSQLRPKTFTKTVFGYLLATIQHEHAYVSNVALMQVMESIGYYFFTATCDAMRAHGMAAAAMQQHTEDDAEHAALGIELIAQFDEQNLRDCDRVINDVYRLMSLMFEEWAGAGGKKATPSLPPRRRRTSRPPRTN
jgi:thiaminase